MQTTEIKIESGIPIPRHTRNIGVTEALRKCKVGDSFVLHAEGNRTGVYSTSKKLGIRIVVRKSDEGFRVWRAA